MADLKEIVAFLDSELKISAIEDYAGAVNGLQIENDGNVDCIFSAVDASLAVVEKAAERGGLLLVHHGMFWKGVQPLTHSFYRKIKAAMDGNLAIYSAHIPLDIHPVFGNNALLAEAIGLKSAEPILEKKGWPMGVAGEWGKSLDELIAAVEKAVNRNIHVCRSGKSCVGKVAVITGGAGSQVSKIDTAQVDAFVTGEGPHWSFIEAEEKSLNVLYAGHYATESFGVEKLGAHLSERYQVGFDFIHRTGGL